MRKRLISAPLLELLEKAHISPSDLDDALNLEGRRGAHTHLLLGHPLLTQIRSATDLPVIDIGRSYRRIGMVIDQPAGPDPAWHYTELKRDGWMLGVRAKFLQASISSLIGGPTGDLIAPTPAIAATIIEEANERIWGVIQLKIVPDYRAF